MTSAQLTSTGAWRVVSSLIPLLARIISTCIIETFTWNGEHYPAIRS